MGNWFTRQVSSVSNAVSDGYHVARGAVDSTYLPPDSKTTVYAGNAKDNGHHAPGETGPAMKSGAELTAMNERAKESSRNMDGIMAGADAYIAGAQTLRKAADYVPVLGDVFATGMDLGNLAGTGATGWRGGNALAGSESSLNTLTNKVNSGEHITGGDLLRGAGQVAGTALNFVPGGGLAAGIGKRVDVGIKDGEVSVGLKLGIASVDVTVNKDGDVGTKAKIGVKGAELSGGTMITGDDAGKFKGAAGFKGAEVTTKIGTDGSAEVGAGMKDKAAIKAGVTKDGATVGIDVKGNEVKVTAKDDGGVGVDAARNKKGGALEIKNGEVAKVEVKKDDHKIALKSDEKGVTVGLNDKNAVKLADGKAPVAGQATAPATTSVAGTTTPAPAGKPAAPATASVAEAPSQAAASGATGPISAAPPGTMARMAQGAQPVTAAVDPLANLKRANNVLEAAQHHFKDVQNNPNATQKDKDYALENYEKARNNAKKEYTDLDPNEQTKIRATAKAQVDEMVKNPKPGQEDNKAYMQEVADGKFFARQDAEIAEAHQQQQEIAQGQAHHTQGPLAGHSNGLQMLIALLSFISGDSNGLQEMLANVAHPDPSHPDHPHNIATSHNPATHNLVTETLPNAHPIAVHAIAEIGHDAHLVAENAIANGAKAAGNAVGTMVSGAAEIATEIARAERPNLSNALHVMENGLGKATQAIGAQVNRVATEAISTLNEMTQIAQPIAKNAIDTLPGTKEQKHGSLLETAKQTINEVKHGAENLISHIKEHPKQAVETATTAVNAIAGMASGMSGNMAAALAAAGAMKGFAGMALTENTPEGTMAKSLLASSPDKQTAALDANAPKQVSSGMAIG